MMCCGKKCLSSVVVVVVLWLVVTVPLSQATMMEKLILRGFQEMFAPYDDGWATRKCLLTFKGEEYVGRISTARKHGKQRPCLEWAKMTENQGKRRYSEPKFMKKKFPGE